MTATPKKTASRTKSVSVAPLIAVKQIVRAISKQNVTNPESDFWKVDDVNAYLAAWLDQGFTLFATHYLGESPEAYNMLYVLIKQ